MFFFPDTIDHLAFLLVFFTLSAAVFPTFIVSFLVLNFGVAACDGAAVWQRPAVNARVKIIAMFFVLMGNPSFHLTTLMPAWLSSLITLICFPLQIFLVSFSCLSYVDTFTVSVLLSNFISD